MNHVSIQTSFESLAPWYSFVKYLIQIIHRHFLYINNNKSPGSEGSETFHEVFLSLICVSSDFKEAKLRNVFYFHHLRKRLKSHLDMSEVTSRLDFWEKLNAWKERPLPGPFWLSREKERGAVVVGIHCVFPRTRCLCQNLPFSKERSLFLHFLIPYTPKNVT